MLTRPTLGQLRQIAEQYGIHLNDADLAFFHKMIDPSMASYDWLDQLHEPRLPVVNYPRRDVRRPSAEENRYNAWYQKCSISGAERGSLTGKRIAIKDNVCVAGVPMMNGSSLLDGYVPEHDATIVTRILHAGGEIVGKAVCEHLCFSAGSHTADSGPVHNPHNPEYSAGGSSSGSAALVVAGECDMAIGCDQGGSIRIPGSWCGAYGLKPTYGLVPYTGIFPLELTLDHVGPLAASTLDVALLLEVIAGEDGLDPRQKSIQGESYTQALAGNIEGLRIGILQEGFAWPGLSESDVDEIVKAAIQRFQEVGTQVCTISIPLHRDGVAILSPLYFEGSLMTVMLGNGMGTNWKGFYSASLLEAFALGRLTRADDLSDMVKMHLLLGHYMHDCYYGRYYAKAQNLVRTLTKAYDDTLQYVDLLAMPTTPMKATRLPGPDATREEQFTGVGRVTVNTCAFNATGHPAMTIPCGLSENLPVGMMLVGRRWMDAMVLRVAYTFEQMSGYTVRPQ